MRSVVSLELTFDAEADAAVRGEWAALADAGLPSQARHTGASNAPHVTLLVRSSLGRVDIGPADVTLPMPVRLGAPVLFGVGERRTLARLVVPTAELLALHSVVHERAGRGDDAAHTLPSAWTPHVTLARRLPVEAVPAALAVLGADGDDTAAAAVSIRRWDARARTTEVVAGHGTLEPC